MELASEQFSSIFPSRSLGLCHFYSVFCSTSSWESAEERRSILFKYSPGYSTWGDPENLAGARELATTDLQRQLLRAP